MAEKISAETLEFIQSSFKSVWALELFFLMRRERTRAWTISELNREMRASEWLLGGILPDLVRKGLVVEAAKDLFQYGVASPEIEQLVDDVATAYAKNRIRVINEIFKVPDRNVRSFADAFRIKKE